MSQHEMEAHLAQEHPSEWKQIRAGLMQLAQYIQENEAQIRAERQALGLENR
ncbi:hypothetical protein [Pectobacterium sp. B1J-3]|uniref:hypothetical protein n=1 Tax=Pectobacterium sp. B1J-3 TaxID=3385371 RepID=UPI00390623A8